MNRLPRGVASCAGSLSLALLLPLAAAAQRGPEYTSAPSGGAAATASPPSLEDIQAKVDAIQAKADDLKAQAQSLGLDPKTATPAEIQAFLEKQALATAAAQLGLGPGATWKDVFGPEGKEAFRSKAAQKLGLPADAPFQDVVKALSEQARTGAAKTLKLGPDATWADISAAAQQKAGQIRDAVTASPAGSAAAAAAKPKLKLLPPLSK